ncbi:FHA domain-containing protein [Nostoc sp. 'Peltigera membranacea cyanobiont' 232]|uniref:FHA domain-containing protein n=1 Tax=Nostoc sp. 'Peltigera membranacea cyanobiont' 232 TaxID=2014531 RepID=UPI000B95B820|nr:FHA domain-containing protein [Nostoc sp. 'Peltigera membranacea cyanobiont' 232]OYE02625.1 peptide-binding protein [Nostoc sp. 'Peltigera membranacea cyanobiont' 232]
MNALTLQWHDAGQDITQNIYEQQPSKNPGTVRIGRDPLRCDIIVSNPTVSGLHVEIFFNSQQQRFYIRNLRSPNPPLVDQQQLVQGELPLREGSIIKLGQMEVKVTAIAINSIPATILTLPIQAIDTNQSTRLPISQQPQVQIRYNQHSPASPPSAPGVYGLECPKCHKVSPLENLQVGCLWCGTSLAAAVSVLIMPNGGDHPQ